MICVTDDDVSDDVTDDVTDDVMFVSPGVSEEWDAAVQAES